MGSPDERDGLLRPPRVVAGFVQYLDARGGGAGVGCVDEGEGVVIA